MANKQEEMKELTYVPDRKLKGSKNQFENNEEDV